jgi:syntaxin-binding protein 1
LVSKVDVNLHRSPLPFPGISRDNFTKLSQHAQIPAENKDMITNMEKLGCNVVLDVKKKERKKGLCCSSLTFFVFQADRRQIWQPKRKKRVNEQTYQMSRWTPILKDLIEDLIEGQLNNSHFAFLPGGQRQESQFKSAPTR